MIKFKRKHLKLVTNFCKKAKIDLSEVIGVFWTDKKVVEVVSDEQHKEFVNEIKKSTEDYEKFIAMDSATQINIILLSINKAERAKKIRQLVLPYVNQADEILEALDELVSELSGKTIDELQELDIPEYVQLIIDIFENLIGGKEGKGFFTTTDL